MAAGPARDLLDGEVVEERLPDLKAEVEQEVGEDDEDQDAPVVLEQCSCDARPFEMEKASRDQMVRGDDFDRRTRSPDRLIPVLVQRSMRPDAVVSASPARR